MFVSMLDNVIVLHTGVLVHDRCVLLAGNEITRH